MDARWSTFVKPERVKLQLVKGIKLPDILIAFYLSTGETPTKYINVKRYLIFQFNFKIILSVHNKLLMERGNFSH